LFAESFSTLAKEGFAKGCGKMTVKQTSLLATICLLLFCLMGLQILHASVTQTIQVCGEMVNSELEKAGTIT